MVHADARTGLDFLALKAERAGAALGCCFSTSDEYEAALIAERRRAGAFGAPRRRHLLVWLTAAAMAVLIAALAL